MPGRCQKRIPAERTDSGMTLSARVRLIRRNVDLMETLYWGDNMQASHVCISFQLLYIIRV